MYFRYSGPGQLVAKAAASAPTTPVGRTWARIKSIAIGRPLASEEEIGELLPKKKALAIFSSDAISSSAYATEEILRVLIVAGAVALTWSIGISMAIALLLAVVAVSYRQVCRAFPGGGGAYAVARSELTPLLGLVAAAALLIDYVMTVAVSTSSAVDQLISIAPGINAFRVEFALVSITLITIANLRGLRESGNIFAIPTYLFVGLAVVIVAVGIFHILTGQAHALPPQPQAMTGFRPETLSIFLLLKAFASGSVALTGTEAIANGVPAFKQPKSTNAANTMLSMAVLLGVLFIGVTIVAHAYAIVPSQDGSGGPTVIALVAQTSLGGDSAIYFIFQLATALILFLAANTSFNAFPRLAAILAEDGYFPRQFSFRGDRLAYSWGIVLLAGVACALLVYFGGITTLLIPLYSVGVFVCFTLSQIGMVRHWRRSHESGWWWRSLVNGFGAVLTAVVLAVVASVKFFGGAYLVVILVPILVAIMLFIHRQYAASGRQLVIPEDRPIPMPHRDERVVVPVPGLNRAVVQAVNVGRTISEDIRAVFITEDPDEGANLRARWTELVPGVPLVIVESPYRALVGPLVAYLDVLDKAWPPDKEAPITFVVVPEYVASSWWERILYNQSSRRLRSMLLGRPHTVVVNVPYRRDSASSDGGGDGGVANGEQGGTRSSSPAREAGPAPLGH